jgi:hypothetical protein
VSGRCNGRSPKPDSNRRRDVKTAKRQENETMSENRQGRGRRLVPPVSPCLACPLFPAFFWPFLACFRAAISPCGGKGTLKPSMSTTSGFSQAGGTFFERSVSAAWASVIVAASVRPVRVGVLLLSLMMQPLPNERAAHESGSHGQVNHASIFLSLGESDKGRSGGRSGRVFRCRSVRANFRPDDTFSGPVPAKSDGSVLKLSS